MIQPASDPQSASHPTTAPRLLVVEDDRDTAELIHETLADHFGEGGITIVGTYAQARDVDLDAYDLVLSDLNLPDGNALELLPRWLDQRPDLPVVFVTGEGILENAIHAIRQGAYDYVVKAGDYLFSIPIIVEKNLALHAIKLENQRLHGALEEKVNQLQAMAATDPLTALANRRAITEALDQRFAQAQRGRGDLAVILIDLDGFKQLNDTLGHQMGDRMLERAARVLEANCRRSDVAGRFGGDEFVVVLPGIGLQAARGIADRIADQFAIAVDAEFRREHYTGQLTMSMGFSTLAAGKAATPEQLVAQADQAMYDAKHAGKTRIRAYPAAPTPEGG